MRNPVFMNFQQKMQFSGQECNPKHLTQTGENVPSV